jgi:hypothetical protein
MADLLVVIHGAFVLFVVCGGFLAWRWPGLAWVHAPAAVWGALIEFAGWVCPLTPLENRFRALAGQSGYPGGFIEHHLIPVIYPSALSAGMQVVLGSFVILVNALAYGVLIRKRTKKAKRDRQARAN